MSLSDKNQEEVNLYTDGCKSEKFKSHAEEILMTTPIKLDGKFLLDLLEDAGYNFDED